MGLYVFFFQIQISKDVTYTRFWEQPIVLWSGVCLHFMFTSLGPQNSSWCSKIRMEFISLRKHGVKWETSKIIQIKMIWCLLFFPSPTDSLLRTIHLTLQISHIQDSWTAPCSPAPQKPLPSSSYTDITNT